MDIALVTVWLDEEVPEYMMGILRIAEVCAEDEHGNDVSHGIGFVDNTEFRSHDAIIEHVADLLKVNKEIVQIENEGGYKYKND
jgi:hypothetical protein